MANFTQLHFLTAYPPANLNRDDLGRPKTAMMGGVQRLRISSQSLKRAWRTSEVFEAALSGHLGTRTRVMGQRVFDSLTVKGVAEGKAKKWAADIAGQFGKLKKDSHEIEQLAHFSPEEERAIAELVNRLAEANQPPDENDLALLRKRHSAADVALFGRMLAASPKFNTEASAQVAHAISVHQTVVEDDFFTAVDDLNTGEEDVGAGHMGETEFGAGLFYLYICLDNRLLDTNLAGAQGLAAKARRSLVEAAATVAPTGKQNSFASRAYASYILAEKGDCQPRSLAVGFLKPVSGSDFMTRAIENLEETREKMNAAYGGCADQSAVMNVPAGSGDLASILDFVEAG